MSKKVKIGFVGDLTTGENYQARYELEYKINILRQKGYRWLFEGISSLLKKFTFTIANLETPLTNSTYSSLYLKKPVLHWADKKIVPELLKSHNISAVSLGNNHAMDYEGGLTETQEALKKENIRFFGAGKNLSDASKPFFLPVDIGSKSFNLYVIGGYKYRKDYDEDFNFYATEDKEGVFLLTPETAKPLISNIKQNDKNAVIVVFPHFGFDLLKNTNLQVEYAHAFIDDGADFVIGHGPHFMNSIEIYKQKPILYSLGNFIFPANFKGKILPFNMIAEIEFFLNRQDEIRSKINIYPTFINSCSYTPQTRLITHEELENFLIQLSEYQPNIVNHLNVKCISDIIKLEFNYEDTRNHRIV